MQGWCSFNFHPVLDQIISPPKYLDQHLFSTYHGLVQVNLPVHDPPAHNEFLQNRSLFFYDQLIVDHIHHFNKPVISYYPFMYAREVAVSNEIIQPVNVQLTAYQMVQELLYDTGPEKYGWPDPAGH